MILKKIIIAISSLMFLMIGADKFLAFLEPPCSLMDSVSPLVWKIFGVLQIAAGILLWFPKFTRYVAGFFFAYMVFFSIVHLTQNTTDIGGAVFMAVLLGILVWDPAFLRAKKKEI